ncbi:trypsin-like peptidase domain-containing protein [Candidatus Bathyarchaeota archaeon]|nr:trypsin-like peptidase domain-containing protein [Candidatus Bathyarchaeota archaeon]
MALIFISVFMGSYFLIILNNLSSQNEGLKERLAEVSVQLTSLKSEVTGLKKLIENLKSEKKPNQTISLTAAWIYNLTKNSVVLIKVTSITPFGRSVAEGTGFVYDKEGHIITNNHVVESGGKITVRFIDGTTVNAGLVGRDPYSDLAVIKVDVSEEKLCPLPLGNSSKLVVGEPVYAVGNPFGLSCSITEGIVSQLGRQLKTKGGYLIVDVIQTDAAINPGNSGGPLLNRFGEVVGVNTAIYSYTGTFSGVGFAIPSNLVRKVVPSLIEKGYYEHPWIGVAGLDVTPEIAKLMGLKEPKGFLVTSVMKGSPAEEAGLRGGNQAVVIEGEEVVIGGDVIIGIDGREIRGINDILIYIERYKNVGDNVTLTIIREGRETEVPLTLGARP